MKLSIITINYNNRDGLQKTIDSVVSQTWRDFEWIVIDGGSTDGSKELIEKYQEHFSYWCCEPDKGVYNAMNKGIAKAKGEYLNFMNSGDCFHGNHVLDEVFKLNNNADVIYGNCLFILNDNNNWVFKPPSSITTHYLLANSLSHQSSFVRTDLLKESGYDESFRICADWCKFVELFRLGYIFSYVDVIISDYDTTGVSSREMDTLQLERERGLRKLFGRENLKWVDESIKMQGIMDRYNNDRIIELYNQIKKRGGLRLVWLFKFMSLLVKTIFIEKRLGLKRS